MSVAIRQTGIGDIARVDALWCAVFPDGPPYNRAAVALPAKLAVQPEFCLVAVEGAEVVGTASGGWDGTRGWLYGIAVVHGHRRRGIGEALVRAVEARLVAAGCPKLNLQVRDGNDGVVAFYRALGFTVEPRVSMGKRLG